VNLSRVAVKQLTASDLTFFSAHYHSPRQRSKQKAINLNADVFVYDFYPGLRDRLAELHFGLTIIGPGNTKPYHLSRKALRTRGAKNWRLNGELINDPADQPGRFDQLAEDDLAVLAFEGADQPELVTLVLISQSGDSQLHSAVSARVKFSGRRTMMAMPANQLLAIQQQTLSAYTDGHPFELLFAADSVEEAVHGSAAAQERIAASGDGRGVAISPESVRRQAATAGEIGQLGEELFEQWLASIGHPDDAFEWVSQINARAAYDFLISAPRWETAGSPLFVDVKATRGPHSATFHMSMAEVRWAATHEEYRIARVSSLSGTSAQIQILSGVSQVCEALLHSILKHLPHGVAIDSFEIDPTILTRCTSDTFIRTESDDSEA
jgi:hypothetical protein